MTEYLTRYKDDTLAEREYYIMRFRLVHFTVIGILF